MKLKRLALIAEVVGAAAILVTMVFVVIELRDSTRAQDAATFQIMSRDLQTILDRLPRELRVKVREQGEPLSEVEQLEYALYTVMALRMGESWWQQWQLGTISEEVFRSYISHIQSGALNGPVARDIWRGREIRLLPGYEAFIDAYIAQNPL